MAEPARDADATVAAPTIDIAAADPRLQKEAARLIRSLESPIKQRGFFLAKLPLALAAGVRLHALDRERCTTSVPYGWRSTNPFRSTYFAALAMAAELATGSLSLLATRLAPEPVALLIVGMSASFEKKATARTTFICEDGARAFAAVAQTLATGEPATAEMAAVGRLPDGAVAARFTFTWSFKVRRRNPS
jgi:Domain of unknown function (DUF4442)